MCSFSSGLNFSDPRVVFWKHICNGLSVVHFYWNKCYTLGTNQHWGAGKPEDKRNFYQVDSTSHTCYSFKYWVRGLGKVRKDAILSSHLEAWLEALEEDWHEKTDKRESNAAGDNTETSRCIAWMDGIGPLTRHRTFNLEKLGHFPLLLKLREGMRDIEKKKS